MLNFILCDDNQNILNRLHKMIESILINKNLSGQVAYSTTNPDNFIDYINKNPFDVVILDIDLKSDLSGMDLANIIRKRNKKAYIIFTTAHLEYILVAYKYKTFDFLAKPITIERLEETIIRLFDDVTTDIANFLRIGNRKDFINCNDVYFIQKQGKRAIFKTSEGDIIINCSFSEILERLPKNFVRCHKSYIANMDKVSYVQSNNEIVFNKKIESQCYIGPKYENLFFMGG